MRSSSFHPYVSRVVVVAPDTAVAGVDFAARCLAVEPSGRSGPSWVIEAGSGRLLLGPVTDRQPAGYLALRTAPGVLRPAGWVSCPVSVELEVLPWSESRSELGLIARARTSWSAPTHRAQQAYLRAAHDVLDVLGRALEAPPPEWLHRLATTRAAVVVPARERARTGHETATGR